MEEDDVHLVRWQHPRDLLGAVLNTASALRLLTRRRFDRVISTGAGIAGSFLPVAAALGVSCHYIESGTRVTGPSLTGRILEHVPRIHLYAQHRQWANDRWLYGGSAYEGFVGSPSGAKSPNIGSAVIMLGGWPGYTYERMVERVVEVLPADVQALWQIGPSDVVPPGLNARRGIPARELELAIRDADLVICHGGMGSVLSALEGGKCPLVLPRRRSAGERPDDHQFQLADFLHRSYLAVVRDPDELSEYDLAEAAGRRISTVPTEPFELAIPS